MVALLNTPSPMRLTDAAEADARERRMFPRKETHSRVEGMRLDHSLGARREPHLSLALRDISVGGCSAMSQVPVEAGERLSLFFPPQGSRRGWDASGRVVRCDPSALGFRVAVEFDKLPIAA